MKKIVTRWILVWSGIGLLPVFILGASRGGVEVAPPLFVACLAIGLLGGAIHSVISAIRSNSTATNKAPFVFLFAVVSIVVVGIQSSNKPISRELEPQAREAISKYLVSKNLPIENLQEYDLSLSPKPDFAYLYTGAGKCLGLIANCDHGNNCRHTGTYPFFEHGEKCPDEH